MVRRFVAGLLAVWFLCLGWFGCVGFGFGLSLG